eukprot:6178516-Pleurochrysis_carterae.AAC.2
MHSLLSDPFAGEVGKNLSSHGESSLTNKLDAPSPSASDWQTHHHHQHDHHHHHHQQQQLPELGEPEASISIFCMRSVACR